MHTGTFPAAGAKITQRTETTPEQNDIPDAYGVPEPPIILSDNRTQNPSSLCPRRLDLTIVDSQDRGTVTV